MDMCSPGKEWFSVAEAATEAGCTDGWLRLLLGKNRQPWIKAGRCWKVGERAWALHRDLVQEIKGGLSNRSLGRRETKKPRRNKGS
jgi:hypothetical protein